MKTPSTFLRPFGGLLLAALALLSGCEKDKEDAPAEAPAPAQAPPQAPSAGELLDVHGTVSVERNGVRRKLEHPEPLQREDIVETGSDGSALLRLPGGRLVELRPDARLSLKQNAEGDVLEVERGILLTRVPAGPTTSGQGGFLSIQTPYGITRVAHPSDELTVTVLKDATQVDVRLGTVTLVSRNGTTSELGAGKSYTLHALELGDAADAGTAPIVLHTLVMTLSPLGSHTELKAVGERRWRTLARNKAVVLTDGDRVRVRSGRPVLALGNGGSTLTLQPGAELSWGSGQEGSAPDGGAPTLGLQAGAAELLSPAPEPLQLGLDGASLKVEQGGNYLVSRDRRGTTVEARLGDARLELGGTSHTIEAGQSARIVGTNVDVHRTAAPLLVVPARGTHAIFHPGLPIVGLLWSGSAPAYRVVVATTTDFAHPLYQGLVHASRVTLPAPKKGVLHWKVLGEDGTSVAEGMGKFAPEASRGELALLRNEVPEGSETTTIFYQDKPPAVTFTYKKDAKAAQYKVSVFRADQLNQPVSERLYPAERAPLEAGVLSEGKYLWSVTPLSAAGAPLRGGKMSKLEMVYDNSVPSLLVFTPKNGDRAQSPVATKGVVPLGYQLLVNDQRVTLDGKQRFDAQAAPVGSPPSLIFHMTRGSGSDVYVVRQLKAR